MKKLAISVVAILAVVVMALSFAACGASGTYKFESLTVGVSSLSKTYEVGDEYLGKELTKDTYVLSLKSNGSFKMTSSLSGDEDPVEGTWEEKDDNKIVLSVEDVPLLTLTKDGNRLTFDMGIGKITLKK